MKEQKGVGLNQEQSESAASHLGSIRFLDCEQSRPAGEQSRSLEQRYYRLVGPSVWKCTCRRAGLQLRRDTGGGVGFYGSLSVSCQFVTYSIYSHSYCSCLSAHPQTDLFVFCIFLPSFTLSPFNSSSI